MFIDVDVAQRAWCLAFSPFATQRYGKLPRTAIAAGNQHMIVDDTLLTNSHCGKEQKNLTNKIQCNSVIKENVIVYSYTLYALNRPDSRHTKCKLQHTDMVYNVSRLYYAIKR